MVPGLSPARGVPSGRIGCRSAGMDIDGRWHDCDERSRPRRPDADHDRVLHRLRARGHPVPGRPRRQQRPGLVHAAQGRLRAPAQGTARAVVRRPRRGVVRARHPARRRSRPIALPHLSRRAVLQGQVAVQDPHLGVVPVGGARRRRAVRKLRPIPTDNVHASGGYFHLQPGETSTSAAASGIPSRPG